jgi:hypothetical protein
MKHAKQTEFKKQRSLPFSLPIEWVSAAPQGFWDNVEIGSDNDCWPWLGSLNNGRYGNYYGGGKKTCSHLVAFRAAHGEMPEDKQCGHTCGHNDCTNPRHMEPVTSQQNNEERGRRYRGRPAKILSEAIVRAARALRATGMKIKDIAAKFGVLAKTLSSAISGKTWAWVTNETVTA